MNDKTLLKIYEEILKESMTLGGGAIGGFTAPAAPYLITKRPKKRKKKKVTTHLKEMDSNFKYRPTLKKDATINKGNWRYNSNQDIFKNYFDLLNQANITIQNPTQSIKLIQQLLGRLSTQANINIDAEIDAFFESNNITFTTNLFSSLRDKLLKELTFGSDSKTVNSVKNQNYNISLEQIKSLIARTYGSSAANLFSELTLKEVPLNTFSYIKKGVSNFFSYLMGAFKVLIYSTGIYKLFEYGGITGVLKEIVKNVLNIDIDSISKSIDAVSESVEKGIEVTKTGASNAINFVSQTFFDKDIIDMSTAPVQQAIEQEQTQPYIFEAWDNFWIWDRTIIYLLSTFIIMNIISIYLVWRDAKTNTREALNAFLNDSIQQAQFDIEIARALAKDAMKLVLSEYQQKNANFNESYYNQKLTNLLFN